MSHPPLPPRRHPLPGAASAPPTPAPAPDLSAHPRTGLSRLILSLVVILAAALLFLAGWIARPVPPTTSDKHPTAADVPAEPSNAQATGPTPTEFEETPPTPAPPAAPAETPPVIPERLASIALQIDPGDAGRSRDALRQVQAWLRDHPADERARKLEEQLQQFFGPQQGKTVQTTGGLRLIYLRPDRFVRGHWEDAGLSENAHPAHEVTLHQGFYIGETEVTEAQWLEVMGSLPRELGAPRPERGDLPVTFVSWHRAMAFCQALSAQEGRRFRLPTEAEWEYASRAGTTTPFSTGITLPTDRAAFQSVARFGSGIERGTPRMAPVPVRSFPPNPWGLYGMHGNVAEWCSDWMGPYPQQPVHDPMGAVIGVERILRGGGFQTPAMQCASFVRDWAHPEHQAASLGFRVVLDGQPMPQRPEQNRQTTRPGETSDAMLRQLEVLAMKTADPSPAHGDGLPSAPALAHDITRNLFQIIAEAPASQDPWLLVRVANLLIESGDPPAGRTLLRIALDQWPRLFQTRSGPRLMPPPFAATQPDAPLLYHVLRGYGVLADPVIFQMDLRSLPQPRRDALLFRLPDPKQPLPFLLLVALIELAEEEAGNDIEPPPSQAIVPPRTFPGTAATMHPPLQPGQAEFQRRMYLQQVLTENAILGSYSPSEVERLLRFLPEQQRHQAWLRLVQQAGTRKHTDWARHQLEAARRTLASDATPLNLRLLLADALIATDQPDDAATLARHLLTDSSPLTLNTQHHVHIGQILAEAGYVREAIPLWNRTLDAARTGSQANHVNHAIPYRIAALQARFGQTGAALRTLQLAPAGSELDRQTATIIQSHLTELAPGSIESFLPLIQEPTTRLQILAQTALTLADTDPARARRLLFRATEERRRQNLTQLPIATHLLLSRSLSTLGLVREAVDLTRPLDGSERRNHLQAIVLAAPERSRTEAIALTRAELPDAQERGLFTEALAVALAGIGQVHHAATLAAEEQLLTRPSVSADRFHLAMARGFLQHGQFTEALAALRQIQQHGQRQISIDLAVRTAFDHHQPGFLTLAWDQATEVDLRTVFQVAAAEKLLNCAPHFLFRESGSRHELQPPTPFPG